jgi:hypothetical protein
MQITYEPGNFGFLESEDNRKLLQDAYDAVNAAEAFEWLKKDTVPGPDGFMFCRDEMIGKISSKMKLMDQHSGASFAWVMRNIECIAKQGWDAYMLPRLPKRNDKE